MSSASSNQLFVRDRVGYDEVFPLGQKDPDTSSEEREKSIRHFSYLKGWGFGDG